TLDAKSAQPPVDVLIDVRELVRRVARAEVVAPSTQHQIDFRDHFANVIMTPRFRSRLFHPLPHSLHAALRRAALEKVDALALLLPDRNAQPLPQVTAEEVEPLFAPRQIHSPRFVRVELELQPLE